jgi:hypothetical protein
MLPAACVIHLCAQSSGLGFGTACAAAVACVRGGASPARGAQELALGQVELVQGLSGAGVHVKAPATAKPCGVRRRDAGVQCSGFERGYGLRDLVQKDREIVWMLTEARIRAVWS